MDQTGPTGPSSGETGIDTVLCDLDGVVWLAHEPIAGSVEAIAALRARGCRVVFVTNNSAARIEEHTAALEAIGIPAIGDVISSATAAAHLIHPGEQVLVTGGPGIVQAVERRGAVVTLNDGTLDSATVTKLRFDAVVVGLDRSFDYSRLAAAAAALHSGARLVGTNSDTTYPTPRGLEPGGGSIVAAVAAAGEANAVFAGKPHPPMAAAIVDLLGVDDRATLAGAPRSIVMVGDRPETDGEMAVALGCRFALVRSGVTTPGQHLPLSDVVVDFDVADLAALAVVVLG